MEQNDINEILDYINEKFDANIPSFVKMLIGKKIHKLQSFDPGSLPDSLRNCTVEELIIIFKNELDSKRLKLYFISLLQLFILSMFVFTYFLKK